MNVTITPGFSPVGDMVPFLQMIANRTWTGRGGTAPRSLYPWIFDRPVEIQNLARTSVRPEAGILYDGVDAMVLLPGMSEGGHAIAFAESILAPSTADIEAGLPSCFSTAASPIYAALVALKTTGIRNLWILGHSWGGGTATALARFIAQERLTWQGVNVQVLTFGAPKSIIRERLSFNGITLRRFVAAGDPVQHIPPKPDAIRSSTFLAGFETAYHLHVSVGRYWHPTAALEVQDDGNVRIVSDAVGPDVRTRVRMATWLAGSEALGSNRHSIEYYLQLFGRGASIQTGGTSEGGDWGGPTGSEEVSRSRSGEIEARNAAEMATEIRGHEARWAAEEVTIRYPQGVPDGIRVRCGRSGGRRVVRVNGEIWGYASRKKQQRQLKNAILDALNS